jgi:hypothetical protein
MLLKMEYLSNIKMEYLIIFFIILIIFLSYYLTCHLSCFSNVKKFGEPKWYMIINNSNLNETQTKILSKAGIKQSNTEIKDTIRFINGYNEVETELKNIPDNSYPFIAGIKGMDYIVAKNYIWIVLKLYYTIPELLKLVPETFVLKDQSDTKMLLETNINNKIFIFKKNIQRQEGLLLLTKKEITQEKINELIKQDFVVAQNYLDNPLIIDTRKVNIRIYLLITISNGIVSAYVYDNGFMYYSQSSYSYSIDTEKAITTGLQKDRSVYERNPLTLKDLKILLKQEKAELLIENINTLLTNIINGTKKMLTGHTNAVNFSLFGCDIQPDSDLNVKLIEINKSPSLDIKDDRDGDVKYALQKDMFEIVGITEKTKENGFYNII